MDLGLRGRAAAVGGASRGLGRACAVALAAEGADVAICARGREDLEAAGADLRTYGVDVLDHCGDLAEHAESFVNAAAQRFGRLDVLVTNIGGPPSGTHETFTVDDFRAALERNFLVAVRMARAALPHMKRAGFGRIINITSIAAKEPLDGLMVGSAARAAVLAWAKTLSREVARHGITVNTIAPGIFMTGRIRELAEQRAAREGTSLEDALRAMETTPAGRMGRPDELGALAAFLASEQAAYITGTTIGIDGGAARGLF